MSEPEAPELTDDDVKRLTDALEAWVHGHPDPYYPAFSFGDDARPLSPSDIYLAVRDGGPAAEPVLRMVRFATEAVPLDTILAQLYGQVEPLDL